MDAPLAGYTITSRKPWLAVLDPDGAVVVTDWRVAMHPVPKGAGLEAVVTVWEELVSIAMRHEECS